MIKIRSLYTFSSLAIWFLLTIPSSSQENSNAPSQKKQAIEESIAEAEPNISNLYFSTNINISNGLLDPQKILDEKQFQTIIDLIADHDKTSKIPITLFLFKNEQTIPLTESKIHTRLSKIFAEKNRLLVYYYYGNALNSKGHLLLADADNLIIQSWEVDEMFLKSARDASIPVDYFEQLATYIKELSKRSFWIESKFIKTPISNETTNLNDVVIKKIEINNQSVPPIQLLKKYSLSILSGLIIISAGIWYYLWTRRWKKHVLPLKEKPQRLGASYGATVSTPLEFLNVKVSLSDQRGKARNKDIEDI